MRRFIDRVTLTGAGHSNDPKELAELSEKYPFVEWGILLSGSGMGKTPRFPGAAWLESLDDTYFGGADFMQLSGHLCGRWVTDMLKKGATIDMLKTVPFAMFDRFQINTHAEPHTVDQECLEYDLLLPNNKMRDVGYGDGQQYIIQMDDVNENLLDTFKDLGYNTAALFDLSHGAGVLPQDWPDPVYNTYCGYAGGLSPDNVVGQIEKIEPLIPEGELIWIDAETHVRSNGDVDFDLDKCEQFLKNVEPYVG